MHRLLFRCASALVLALMPAGFAGASTIYLDEAAFLLAAGPVTMESFESLPLSGTSAASVDAGAFAMSTSVAALTVRNDNVLGSRPTDGLQYVRWVSTNARSLVFTFDAPADRFGVTFTDVLDGSGSMDLATNGGASVPGALSGPLPDGAVQFLGFVADNPFTQLTLTVNLSDGLGLDEVLYNVADQSAPVPEPASLLLFGAGAAGAWVRGRRRKAQTARARP